MMEETESSAPRTPVWVPLLLGLQFLLAIIILGLSAYIIHGKYFNTLGFTIFVSVLTWFVVAYNFATLYVASLKQYRIQYAPLAIDAVMFIFWLSGMGAAAALRASFKYTVTVEGCYNDGSLVNSSTCVVKRDLEKRAAVATSTGLSIMSAIAGLSALEMLLFLGSLIFGIIEWNKSRSQATTTTEYLPQKHNEGYQMESTQQSYGQAPQPGMPQQPYAQQPYTQQSYAPQQQQGMPQQPQTQPQTGYYSNLPAAAYVV